MLAGLALWPIDRASQVIRGWRDYVDNAPDELSTACVVVTAPPEEFVPDHLKGQTALGMAVMYVGDPEKGASIVRPLKDLVPEVDLIQPMPYTTFQAILDPLAPTGNRSYWRGEYMNNLTDETIDTFVEHAPTLSRGRDPVQPNDHLPHRTGRRRRSRRRDRSLQSRRQLPVPPHLHVGGPGRRRAADRSEPRVRRCDAALRTGGAYLNFTPEADRVRDAYGEKYERLVALKDTYDPDNVFRMNQNIKPSRASGEPMHA